jgi:cob(I)alamin adenosyltransferase
MTSTDIPETVDLRWIAQQLIALQNDIASLRDDMTVTTAALNRLDDNMRRLNGNMSLIVTELRAMRSARGECQIFCVRGFRDG